MAHDQVEDTVFIWMQEHAPGSLETKYPPWSLVLHVGEKIGINMDGSPESAGPAADIYKAWKKYKETRG